MITLAIKVEQTEERGMKKVELVAETAQTCPTQRERALAGYVLTRVLEAVREFNALSGADRYLEILEKKGGS